MNASISLPPPESNVVLDSSVTLARLQQTIQECVKKKSVENAARVCLGTREAWFQIYCDFLATSREHVAPYKSRLLDALKESESVIDAVRTSNGFDPHVKLKLQKYRENVAFRRTILEKVFDGDLEGANNAIVERQKVLQAAWS